MRLCFENRSLASGLFFPCERYAYKEYKDVPNEGSSLHKGESIWWLKRRAGWVEIIVLHVWITSTYLYKDPSEANSDFFRFGLFHTLYMTESDGEEKLIIQYQSLKAKDGIKINSHTLNMIRKNFTSSPVLVFSTNLNSNGINSLQRLLQQFSLSHKLVRFFLLWSSLYLKTCPFFSLYYIT